MPSRIAFSCLVFAEDSRFERLAMLVQRQLAEVGIDMKLEPVTLKELETRAHSGDFDAFLFEMAGGQLSWVYDFWHSQPNGLVKTGYTAIDGILDDIRRAVSDDEVKAGVGRMNAVLHDDPPAAFLVWQTQTRAVSTKFDVQAEPNRDILGNVWQWHLASGEQAHR
jgi:ABC-type transport system substrate-binding protein